MNKQKILIVDDEPELLKSLRMILKEHFNVITASNGMAGLRAFKSKQNISIILLDLDMPVMDGLDALKAFRDINNKVKVIIITGRSSHEYACKCADMNVQGYIKKPLNPEKLIERINKIIGINTCPVLENLWKEEYEIKLASISPVIKKAITFVHENAHKDIKRDDVSAYLGITPDHLSKTLNKECGLSISEYIKRYKILKSHEYLLDMPDMKIAQVAEKIGITDANYFSRLFKRYSGLPPGEFRRKSPHTQGPPICHNMNRSRIRATND